MRQMTTLRGVLAGLALIALAGSAPVLAQSSPPPQPGLEPIGASGIAFEGVKDPFPRYAVIPQVRLILPEDLPPGEVKPVGDTSASGLGVASSSQTVVERPTLGMGATAGSPRRFGGVASAAPLPERFVDVRRVRKELAGLRAELGL